MDKTERYEDLLDTIYELEGLVHLAIVRGDNAPKRILSLISEKISRLDEAKKSLSMEVATPVHLPEMEEYVVEDEERKDDDFWVEASEIQKADAKDAEVAEEEIGIIERAEVTAIKHIPTDDTTDDATDDTTEIIEHEDDRECNESEAETLSSGHGKKPRTAPSFSINDRFLYIREIFGGDGKAFDREMDRLDEFEDYDEAEQYFLEEYSLDPEAPSVVDFLAIIERYYQS